MSCERTLSLHRRVETIDGAREGNKERIALGIHFVPIPLFEYCAHNFALLDEDLSVLFP